MPHITGQRMAALALFMTEPSDRALRGWAPYAWLGDTDQPVEHIKRMLID